MKKVIFILLLFVANALFAQRNIINLNGKWDFEQTDKAFPPAKFTRKCPVPGLIHLAEPRIADYDVFFKKPDKPIEKEQHDFRNLDYTPRYSWYKKKVFIPADYSKQEAILTIKKSQYVTNVYVNGYDLGSSMECYTPIEQLITQFIKFGDENEILIRIGDRVWLPSQAAGGTDKEKEHYLPGIWDDVYISFIGKLRLNKTLLLPSVKENKLSVKIQIRNFKPAQIFYGDPMFDTCRIEMAIREKLSKKQVAISNFATTAKRDNISITEHEIIFPKAHKWTPDDPFLYEAIIKIIDNNGNSDEIIENFGMRDFTRVGRFFYLNGEKTILRGTNITLQRFFEDPDCADLVWNRAWVTKLLADIPKQLNWNTMRICVGVVPDFWYDIADSAGLMLQNEWLYWQNHGWDAQIKKEYTDWVWSDGNHPSIVIWDAINENWDSYIGNTLIPELKKLDPTRIWDAGYMTGHDMALDEMDEPHPYRAGWELMQTKNADEYLKVNPYNLGKLGEWTKNQEMFESSAAQLVNEYGWIWLWRDGRPAKLTKNAYDYLVGIEATPEQRRELQAYWLQAETEWLRAERSLAGVLAFCYLANNYGYTGDWFTGNIADLEWSPALSWFKHCFSPVAAFIDLADERYFKHIEPHTGGSQLSFNVVAINDNQQAEQGDVQVNVYDKAGNVQQTHKFSVTIPAYGKTYRPMVITLPSTDGGYLLTATLMYKAGKQVILSRRYINIGKRPALNDYYQIKP